MQYFIGGLVGVVLTFVFMSIMSKFLPPNPSEVDEALMKHWKQWDMNEYQRNLYLQKIADSVTTWEQRYTRRVKKATKAEE